MARNLIKSMATVSGLIMLSRVFGFARQVLIAGVIGASGSPVADAFWAAFRLPNMFRRLLAEGAFQAAFIPLFQGRHVEGGDEEAKRFAEDILAWMIFILTGLSALVMIFAPAFVWLIATGFENDPTKFDLATDFTVIMFPYLACMSLVGLCGGILNALHKFAASSAAPVAFNVIMIIVVLIYADRGVTVTGYAAAWSVFAAGLAQLAILMIGAWRSGFLLKLRLPRWTPHVKRMLSLGWPGFIGAGALQINSIVGTNIASRQDGAISWLMNADQLYQLPLSMIGITLGIVLMPAISRAVKEGDEPAARSNLNRGLELVLLFSLPAAAALVAIPTLLCVALFIDFAGDALSLVGQSESAYLLRDAEATGLALSVYALGLVSFCLQKVVAAAYFARENTRTPMKFALVAITINIVISLTLFPVIGFIAIPIATIAASWSEVTLLSRQLWKAGILRPDERLKSRAPRLFAAAVLMGGAVWLAAENAGLFAPYFLGQAWLFLLALVALGGALYFALCIVFRAARLSDFTGLMKGRATPR